MTPGKKKGGQDWHCIFLKTKGLLLFTRSKHCVNLPCFYSKMTMFSQWNTDFFCRFLLIVCGWAPPKPAEQERAAVSAMNKPSCIWTKKKKKKHGNDLSVVYTNKNAFTIFFLVLYTHLLSHVVSRDIQVHEKKRMK
jgi:hypothetical protein